MAYLYEKNNKSGVAKVHITRCGDSWCHPMGHLPNKTRLQPYK